MKNGRILKIYDLIQEVKETDAIIALHRDLTDDRFMTEQYIARKDKLFAKLLTELAHPALASAGSFHLAQQLITKFYTATESPAALDMVSDLEALKRLVLT